MTQKRKKRQTNQNSLDDSHDFKKGNWHHDINFFGLRTWRRSYILAFARKIVCRCRHLILSIKIGGFANIFLIVTERTENVVLSAAFWHRVEMLQALTKVESINWNDQDPDIGYGVAHYAIETLKDSCYQIIEILLNIEDFDINFLSKNILNNFLHWQTLEEETQPITKRKPRTVLPRFLL